MLKNVSTFKNKFRIKALFKVTLRAKMAMPDSQRYP